MSDLIIPEYPEDAHPGVEAVDRTISMWRDEISKRSKEISLINKAITKLKMIRTLEFEREERERRQGNARAW